MSQEISIYNFIDYREYLAAWFSAQKESQYGFSFRAFNRRASIQSPNYMQRIINKQRTLSNKYLPNVIKAMNLSEAETRYFVLMITLEKSRIESEREEILCTLIQLRSEANHGKLTKPMLHYLSHWYYPVIRELIVLHQTKDVRQIGKLLRPKVANNEISEAIKFLFQNDYIQDSDQGFVHTNPILTTGDEIVSHIVSHYHRETLNLTANELSDTPLDERDVSSLILSLSKASFAKMKQEIQLFRKKLLQIADEENTPDRVYHVGFHLVPRSKADIKGVNE